jgi:hypothetical protein
MAPMLVSVVVSMLLSILQSMVRVARVDVNLWMAVRMIMAVPVCVSMPVKRQGSSSTDMGRQTDMAQRGLGQKQRARHSCDGIFRQFQPGRPHSGRPGPCRAQPSGEQA